MIEITAKSIKELENISESFDNPTYSIVGKVKDYQKLLVTENWPKAVPEGLIVRNDEQIKIRAKSILFSYKIYDTVNDEPTKTLCDYANANFKLLDYGCGNGQVAMAANEMGFDALGYDIKKQWDNPNPSLTTNFGKITNHGPYNVILLYDVIDHLSDGSQIIEMMRGIRKLCNSNTKLLLRTHPWTSRHASHSYYKLNKAWAHLFLDDKQLAQYTDYETFFKVNRPINQYRDIFTKSGFKIDHHEIVRSPIDSFFKNDNILAEIASKFNANPEWVTEVLQYEFVDYQLSINVQKEN